MKCIMCNNKDFKGPLFTVRDRFNLTKKDYYVFSCKVCKTLLINPLPDEEEILNLYPEDYTFKLFDKNVDGKVRKLIKNIEYNFFYKAIYKRNYKIISKKLGKKQFSIFDIGCGNAHRLKIFSEFGCEVYGSEVSKEDVEYARNNLGIEVFYGTLEQVINNIDKKFDVVSLFSVFEHLKHPYMEINIVKKLLKKDGLLVIQVPVINTIQYILLGKYCFSIREMPRHLFIPSISGLKIFMNNLNFELMDYKPVSFIECSSLFSLGIFWKSNSCVVYQQNKNNISSLIKRFIGWSLSVIPGSFIGFIELLRGVGIESIFIFRKKLND